MPEYLENPRRTIRAPLRCNAVLTRASGAVMVPTEDIGAHGCCLAVPSPSPRGEIVGLALTWPSFDPTLRVNGRVAWTSARAPWRMGIAFLDEFLPQATRWLDQLITADRSVLKFRMPPPKRVDMDTTVYLAPPPSLTADFTDEEQRLLRAVRLGAPVHALRQQLGLDKPHLARVLFALLSKQAVTLSRASAAQPGAWSRILAARPAALAGDLDGDPAAPTDIETFDRIRAMTARTPAPGLRPEILPDPARGGGAPRPRSPEAQMLLNSGLAELELQRPQDALVYLRRALVLAPGDAEIASAIGRATGRMRSGQ